MRAPLLDATFDQGGNDPADPFEFLDGCEPFAVPSEADPLPPRRELLRVGRDLHQPAERSAPDRPALRRTAAGGGAGRGPAEPQRHRRPGLVRPGLRRHPGRRRGGRARHPRRAVLPERRPDRGELHRCAGRLRLQHPRRPAAAHGRLRPPLLPADGLVRVAPGPHRRPRRRGRAGLRSRPRPQPGHQLQRRQRCAPGPSRPAPTSSAPTTRRSPSTWATTSTPRTRRPIGETDPTWDLGLWRAEPAVGDREGHQGRGLARRRVRRRRRHPPRPTPSRGATRSRTPATAGSRT